MRLASTLLPATTLLATTLAVSAFGQATFPGCGYLNGAECTIYDNEFWIGGTGPCDWGLAKNNGSCVMGSGRQSFPFDQSWVVWALNTQQRYRIGQDAKIDQVFTLGTHNSYSSYLQGFSSIFSTDQEMSITDQLNWGMRVIRLDPANYYGQWRVCHNSGTSECYVPGISSNRLFSYAVREVSDWLSAHRNELIYLLINFQDSDPNSDIEAILKNYIPANKFLTPADVTAYGAWPTMKKVLSEQKQVVMFSHGYISDLGFSYFANLYKNHTSDSNFSSCGVWSGDAGASTLYSIRDLGALTVNSAPVFSETGEDRTGSVAFQGLGLANEAQIRTAVTCGYSMVDVDFVNDLAYAYYDFAEDRQDTRREAAVWSWAQNDYGTLGPAVLRLIDARWTSAPIGTNYGYACAIDTDGSTTVATDGNPRYRNWYVATGTGPWNNGQAACASASVTTLNGIGGLKAVSGYFAFPRNGKENNDLWQAQIKAGLANLWLNYSANNGSGSLIVNTNPVPVIRNGDPPPPLVFDISTSAAIPAAGVTLSVQLNLGTGTLTTDETTIYSPSALRSYTLPGLWSTSQNPGAYTSNARIVIVSKSGTTLAETSVPFKIIVNAGTTTTISSVTNPVAEGFTSTFQVNVTSNVSSIPPDGTVQLFELLYDTATQTYRPQNITPPTLWMQGQTLNAVLALPPGTHQVGARFTSIGQYQVGSQSDTVTQTVSSFINPTPSSLTFVMDAGGPLPPSQSFSGKSNTQPPAIASNVNWAGPISTSGAGVQFTTVIGTTAAAQLLAPGQYTGQITASDATHATQNVALTLNVRGTLQVSTTAVNYLTSGADYTTIVTLLQGGAFPLQVEASPGGSWATVIVVPDVTNPLNAALLVNLRPKGLAPGIYKATYRISSILSANTPAINITMTVVPLVTIDANALGITAAIDNVTYHLPKTFTWQPGSMHTISTTGTQFPPSACAPPPCESSNAKFEFQGWNSGPAIGQSIKAPTTGNDRSNWHATFGTLWRLQADPIPAAGGTVSVLPGSPDGFYSDGQQVTITAGPASGYTFAGFSGDLSGTANPQNLAMNTWHSLSASFVLAPVSITIASSVSGLPMTVDGSPYTTPATFTWQQGSNHNVAFAALIGGGSGTQYLFRGWTDGPWPASRTIQAGAANATYTATIQTQFYLNASPSPAMGGTVTGSGWYVAGTTAQLQATAAAGFQFSSFSSDPASNVNSTQNPFSLAMDRPKTVAANFAPKGAPVIYAAPGGPNWDDSNGNRNVPITLKNVGQGAAVGVQISGISEIKVMTGIGPVTAAGGSIAVPDMAPNASSGVSVPFQWPATATRIQFRVNFTANQGSYSGSTVLNLFR